MKYKKYNKFFSKWINKKNQSDNSLQKTSTYFPDQTCFKNIAWLEVAWYATKKCFFPRELTTTVSDATKRELDKLVNLKTLTMDLNELSKLFDIEPVRNFLCDYDKIKKKNAVKKH